MKRFTIFSGVLSFGVLVAWMIFQGTPAPKPSSAGSNDAPIQVYDATGEMLKAIHAGDGYVVPVTGAEETVPVYDATGEMLKAIHAGDGYVAPVTGADTNPIPVYDATGEMLKAIHAGDGYVAP
jgi:hypothetical protein